MSRIPMKRLADLCHRVGVSYRAGVDLRAIWDRESQSGSPRHRQAMTRVSEKVASGHTVAEGLRNTNGYFPELACAIAEAGETGGRLEQSFKLLANHYDTLVRFWRDMMGRLAWPLFQLFGAVVIIALFILAMGWATQVSASGETIDWIGWGWTTMQYFWAWVSFALLSFLLVAALVYGSLSGWYGNYPMRIARRLPLLGRTIQILSLARFAWVLAAVYEAGMNTMNGVALAFRSTRNFYYEQFEQQVCEQIQEGTALADALRLTGAFPSDLLTYVENGETSGELPESMTRLAEQYTAEAERNLSLISKIMFFVIFSIIALIIAAMVITLMLRYVGMLQEFSEI